MAGEQQGGLLILSKKQSTYSEQLNRLLCLYCSVYSRNSAATYEREGVQ